MSEKRFKIFEQPMVSCDKYLVIVECEENVLNVEEVVDLLNYLEEENKKLKEQNRKLYKCALICDLNEQQAKINELEDIILDLTNNTPVVVVKKNE